MTRAQKLLFIHLWLMVYVCIMIAAMRGKMSERNYQVRMNPAWRWFLMPGRWRNEQTYLRFERLLILASLPLAALVYAGALLDAFSAP